MIRTVKRYTLIQAVIIVFIWMIMFAIPLLFGNFPKDKDWQAVIEVWTGYGYLLLLFIFNHFVLLPHLFFKEKRIAYFVVAIVSITLFFSAIYVSYSNRMPMPRGIEKGFMHGSPQHPRHSDMDAKDGFLSHEKHDEFMGKSQRAGRPHPDNMPPKMGAQREPFVPPYANLLIFSILLLGFDTGLSVSMKWLEDEQKRIELEKENTENKLTFLRQQVSPHFFMNTLNNIHALIDINQDKAKESVIKLSKLMNYLIYDTQGGKVLLNDELVFIESYIELMQLRFSDKVILDVNISEPIPHIEIAPLLFISFIENAFKYGISYQAPSYVKIGFKFLKSTLIFTIENSIHSNREKREKSGFGIENTRKRLDLIYNDVYDIKISEDVDKFSVQLTLPL